MYEPNPDVSYKNKLAKGLKKGALILAGLGYAIGLGGIGYQYLPKNNKPSAQVSVQAVQPTKTIKPTKSSVQKPAQISTPINALLASPGYLPDNCKAVYFVIGHRGEETISPGGVGDDTRPFGQKIKDTFAGKTYQPPREYDLNTIVAKSLKELLRKNSPRTNVYFDNLSGQKMNKTQKAAKINKELEDLLKKYSKEEIAVVHLHMDDNDALRNKPAAVAMYNGPNSGYFSIPILNTPLFDNKQYMQKAEDLGNAVLDELDRVGIKSRWISVMRDGQSVKRRVVRDTEYADKGNLPMLNEVNKVPLNILIEMGNIGSEKDVDIVQNKTQDVANAIIRGLGKYYSSKN